MISSTRIFFMYLAAGLGLGTAAGITTEMVAPEVAKDVKKHVFRNRFGRDKLPRADESVR